MKQLKGVLETDPVVKAMDMLGVNFNESVWCIARPSGNAAADSPIIFDWDKLQHRLSFSFEQEPSFAVTLKRVAGCLLSGVGGRRYAVITVRQQISWYRNFFLVLQREGHSCLRLITSSQARECFEESLRCNTHGKVNSITTVNQKANLLNRLHSLREYLGDGFEQAPLAQKHRNRFKATLAPKKMWEAPPEPVCFYLLRQSIRIVNCLAEDVDRIFTRYVEAVEVAKNTGISNRRRIAQWSNAAIAGESFTDPESTEFVRELKASTAQDVAWLKNQLYTACYIIITYTCGPRISEIRRATTNSLKEVTHTNGEKFHYYYAHRSKKRFSSIPLTNGPSEPDDTPWILSPAAVIAIEWLVRLSRPARERSKLDNLWLTTNGNSLWPFKSEKCSVLSSTSVNIRLNQFAKFINVEDVCGWSGRLHSHMGRKHLARFIAKRDRSELGDLALQYSHVSAYSIDVNYASPDSEFRRMVQDELRHEMEEVARSLTKCENFYSTDGSLAISTTKKFLGRMLTDSQIKKLISKETILVPCQWGVCVYRQEVSSCHGSRTEPNPRERAPEVCSGCSNFIAFNKHRKWWEDYRDDSKRYLSCRSIPRQTRMILEKRLSDAEKVLAKIG